MSQAKIRTVTHLPFNPHACGECNKPRWIISRWVISFNPHACGECNKLLHFFLATGQLSTPTHVGNVTSPALTMPRRFISFNPHACGECNSTPRFLDSTTTSFNPHACGECNWEQNTGIFPGFSLSTPTHVGNVTFKARALAESISFQPPRMWGM